MHNKKYIADLSTLHRVRALQKELALADVSKTKDEESLRLVSMQNASEKLETVQGIWTEVIKSDNIHPDLLAASSSQLIAHAQMQSQTKSEYENAQEMSEKAALNWRMCDANLKSNEAIATKLRRRLVAHHDEAEMQNNEDRTSYLWGCEHV